MKSFDKSEKKSIVHGKKRGLMTVTSLEAPTGNRDYPRTYSITHHL